MRFLLIYIFLLLKISCFSNMASPWIEGGQRGTAFTSKNIEITHESIFMKINKGFQYCDYTVLYKIKTDTGGVQIPMLFYAIDFQNNFRVFIDGNEISSIKYLDIKSNDSILKNYTIIDDLYSEHGVELKLGNNSYYLNKDNELKYFEFNFSKGAHEIRVEFKSIAWQYRAEWTKEYSFRYSLSPVKYWKSFGGLDLIIDNTENKTEYILNVGNPNFGKTDSIANWKFNKLPANYLIATSIPKINWFANLLINIHPAGLSLILLIILFLIHIKGIITYRKKNIEKRFSPIVIIWSLIIPLLVLIAFLLFFDIIEFFIRPEGDGNHGYVFLALLLYVPLMPVYLIIMGSLDYFYKSKLTKT